MDTRFFLQYKTRIVSYYFTHGLIGICNFSSYDFLLPSFPRSSIWLPTKQHFILYGETNTLFLNNYYWSLNFLIAYYQFGAPVPLIKVMKMDRWSCSQVLNDRPLEPKELNIVLVLTTHIIIFTLLSLLMHTHKNIHKHTHDSWPLVSIVVYLTDSLCRPQTGIWILRKSFSLSLTTTFTL